MSVSEKKLKTNIVRQEEEVSNWSELCPDLLRCVCKRLSFTELSRVKSICSSWQSGSTGCVPIPNQIPWLILFPSYKLYKVNDNTGSCALFIPDDKNFVYRTRDLGADFVENRCLGTYSSWLLMLNLREANLYILNPLTGERIHLPDSTKREVSQLGCAPRGCFWIHIKTKDYLVFLMMEGSFVFTKKGENKWHEFFWFEDSTGFFNSKILYNHKNQKLYVHRYNPPLTSIWDFSGDKPQQDGFLNNINCYYNSRYWDNLTENKISLAVTISGDVLMVSCCEVTNSKKTWRFRVYKANHLTREWVEIDSLGDEALILDMGVTIEANDVQEIKRNSIYFSGIDYERNLDNIFVFDLTTQTMEPLPQCVFSSVQFSDARWFFPGFNG